MTIAFNTRYSSVVFIATSERTQEAKKRARLSNKYVKYKNW